MEEMKVLANNETWKLVPLPPEKELIGYKWVFTVKRNIKQMSQLKSSRPE